MFNGSTDPPGLLKRLGVRIQRGEHPRHLEASRRFLPALKRLGEPFRGVLSPLVKKPLTGAQRAGQTQASYADYQKQADAVE